MQNALHILSAMHLGRSPEYWKFLWLLLFWQKRCSYTYVNIIVGRFFFNWFCMNLDDVYTLVANGTFWVDHLFSWKAGPRLGRLSFAPRWVGPSFCGSDFDSAWWWPSRKSLTRCWLWGWVPLSSRLQRPLLHRHRCRWSSPPCNQPTLVNYIL